MRREGTLGLIVGGGGAGLPASMPLAGLDTGHLLAGRRRSLNETRRGDFAVALGGLLCRQVGTRVAA